MLKHYKTYMKGLCQGSATRPVFTQPARLLATQRLKQLQSFNIEFHYIKYPLILHPHYMLYITSGYIKLAYITFNYLIPMPACFLLMVPPLVYFAIGGTVRLLPYLYYIIYIVQLYRSGPWFPLLSILPLGEWFQTSLS